MGQETGVERKLYLLKCMNPKVVTRTTADEAKWAAESIELLRGLISACPARDYWGHLVLRDARVRELIGDVL
jgi:hypothetical protein